MLLKQYGPQNCSILLFLPRTTHNLQLQKLEENETERSRRHEEQMKSLEQQRAELEERERNFERERFAFEATHQEYADMFRKMTIDNRE